MEKPQRVQRTTLYALLAQACQRASATKPHFAPVDEEDVHMALKRARTTWSAGVDDVPMAILKRVADCTAPHLAEITNTTAHEKVQPRRWKMAQICAMWKKKGGRREIKTHRPVALLPAVSRIVEKVLSVQLLEQFVASDALPDAQHGFRPKHGTNTAIMHLTAKVASILEQEGPGLRHCSDGSIRCIRHGPSRTVVEKAEGPGGRRWTRPGPNSELPRR